MRPEPDIHLEIPTPLSIRVRHFIRHAIRDAKETAALFKRERSVPRRDGKWENKTTAERLFNASIVKDRW